MSDSESLFLLFQKDFIESGNDRYFFYDGDTLVECSSQEIVELDQQLVTHDYWLIAPSIHKATGKLPNLVVDVNQLHQLLIGRNLPAKVKNESSIKSAIRDYFEDPEELRSYFSIFYRMENFSSDVYTAFGEKFSLYWNDLKEEALERNEWERFESIELPVSNLLENVAVRGIRVDQEALALHKSEIDSVFYSTLKGLALEFGLNIEVPRNGYLRDVLFNMGFGPYLEDYGKRIPEYRLDDILELLSLQSEFCLKTLKLRKLERCRVVLDSISLHKTRVYPIVESHRTVTSRVYYQNPVVQNLTKVYRNIICADPGFDLMYADFDQFEIGIMSALSGDEAMYDVYKDGDIYTAFSSRVFGSDEYRKISKSIFLSYTYGMSVNKIFTIVAEQGGSQEETDQFFAQFERFEEWKGELQERYLAEGRIGTMLGNHRVREGEGPLSSKEKRSCLSQVVQGTGSLIFKKALLAIAADSDIGILVPMHDAVLVQCASGYDSAKLIGYLEQAMKAVLGEEFPAKASLGAFFEGA